MFRAAPRFWETSGTTWDCAVFVERLGNPPQQYLYIYIMGGFGFPFGFSDHASKMVATPKAREAQLDGCPSLLLGLGGFKRKSPLAKGELKWGSALAF